MTHINHITSYHRPYHHLITIIMHNATRNFLYKKGAGKKLKKTQIRQEYGERSHKKHGHMSNPFFLCKYIMRYQQKSILQEEHHTKTEHTHHHIKRSAFFPHSLNKTDVKKKKRFFFSVNQADKVNWYDITRWWYDIYVMWIHWVDRILKKVGGGTHITMHCCIW